VKKATPTSQLRIPLSRHRFHSMTTVEECRGRATHSKWTRHGIAGEKAARSLNAHKLCSGSGETTQHPLGGSCCAPHLSAWRYPSSFRVLGAPPLANADPTKPFKNCSAAKAAGYCDIPSNSPMYTPARTATTTATPASARTDEVGPAFSLTVTLKLTCGVGHGGRLLLSPVSRADPITPTATVLK